MLGVALSAYEYWLADESVSLPQALGDAFDVVAHGLGALRLRTVKFAIRASEFGASRRR